MAIGPIDTAIVFGGLTAGVHRPERFRLAWQAIMVAGFVLLGFALFGNQVLAALRVSLDAFRVAGGILLLLQAIQMIFAHPAGLSSLTDLERREAMGPGDIAIFPLAFPVIAGPAGLTYLCMIFTDVLHRMLKATGSNVVARLAGVVLAALAVQFIFDGIRGARLLG